nr:MAG TPA: hypothetical protein [Caudoviricetes sp.]
MKENKYYVKKVPAGTANTSRDDVNYPLTGAYCNIVPQSPLPYL